MLIEVNLWLGRIAPWLWMGSSIFALLLCAKAWRLMRTYERSKGANDTTIVMRFIAMVLSALGGGMVLTGAFSLTTWFVYPAIRAQRYDVPLLMQASSFVTVVTLLAVPFILVLIGWRVLRFTVLDPPSQPSTTRSRGGARPARKKSH